MQYGWHRQEQCIATHTTKLFALSRTSNAVKSSTHYVEQGRTTGQRSKASLAMDGEGRGPGMVYAVFAICPVVLTGRTIPNATAPSLTPPHHPQRRRTSPNATATRSNSTDLALTATAPFGSRQRHKQKRHPVGAVFYDANAAYFLIRITGVSPTVT